MLSNVTILQIGPVSDGDEHRRPASDLPFVRNDTYYLERIASDKWIKDLPGGAQPGMKYQLDRLPAGYAGFEKTRSGTTHVDRYIYGHPKGVFRSLNEFYPHFKHLMDNQHAHGCPCKLCGPTITKKKVKVGGGEKSSAASGSPVRQSPFFAQPQKPASASTQAVSRLQDSPVVKARKKQVDEDGTVDIYRKLLDKLNKAGSDGFVNERIVEDSSPDWREAHEQLENTLGGWKVFPSYVPRQGEIVMFVRYLGQQETLGWDGKAQTWRIVDLAADGQWLDRARWEAGIVTQAPTEPVIAEDVLRTSADKQNNVIYSGFRIEPMPKPGSVTKTHSKQHKYVPLHAIRPMSMWQDCVQGIDEKDRDSTVNHALTVASSFCILGRFHFKGIWPEATVFAKAVYIGPELVMVGDTVRLLPRLRESRGDAVTDVMVVTAVKLKFVNLDEAGDDDYDDGRPYNTCLHISGRPYTLDPTQSYDGIGKLPIKNTSGVLPAGMMALGQWYHKFDPKQAKARLEVPYHRIIGRCHEDEAIQAWFNPPKGMPPPSAASAFQAVNTVNPPTPSINLNGHPTPDFTPISHGLSSVRDSRAYSLATDHRIEKSTAAGGGKSWFWADTRVEQLDLHEVNGHFVGVRDETRSKAQMENRRKALKALDGKRGALEEWHGVTKGKEMEIARKGREFAESGMGIVTDAQSAVVGAEPCETEAAAKGAEAEMEDGDGDANEDAMDVDKVLLEAGEESDVEMEEAQGALAAFKARSTAAASHDAPAQGNVISLLDGDSDE